MILVCPWTGQLRRRNGYAAWQHAHWTRWRRARVFRRFTRYTATCLEDPSSLQRKIVHTLQFCPLSPVFRHAPSRRSSTPVYSWGWGLSSGTLNIYPVICHFWEGKEILFLEHRFNEFSSLWRGERSELRFYRYQSKEYLLNPYLIDLSNTMDHIASFYEVV